jgi:hypothetical protein
MRFSDYCVGRVVAGATLQVTGSCRTQKHCLRSKGVVIVMRQLVLFRLIVSPSAVASSGTAI